MGTERSLSCIDGSCISHVLKLWFWSSTPAKFSLCCWSWTCTFSSPVFWRCFSCQKFLWSYSHFLSFIDILRIDRKPNLVKRFSPSSGCVLPSWVVSPSPELLASALPSESLHLKSPLDLSLFHMALCIPIRSLETNHCNGHERTSRNS